MTTNQAKTELNEKAATWAKWNAAMKREQHEAEWRAWKAQPTAWSKWMTEKGKTK
jgi:hypothetical protein